MQLLSITQHATSMELNRFAKAVENNKFFPVKHIHDAPVCTQDVYCFMYLEYKMVAFGMIRGWDDGWDDKILGIIVHPDFRGNGYGKLMMQTLHTVASMRGLKRVRLHVDKENESAIHLYNKLGYRHNGFRKDGEWIMIKEIE